MGHSNQFYRMRMQGSLIATARLQQIMLHHQVGRQFGSRHNRTIGNNLIMRSILRDADDRTVIHRFACQVTHTFLRTFCVEIMSLQHRKCRSDSDRLTQSWYGCPLRGSKFGNAHRYITAIPFTPSFLPDISGYFRNLGNNFCEHRICI